MIRGGAARLETLQVPPRLRSFLGEQIVQHLTRDEARAATHREDAIGVEQLERLHQQTPITAQGVVNGGVRARELGRVEHDDAESFVVQNELVELDKDIRM